MKTFIGALIGIIIIILIVVLAKGGHKGEQPSMDNQTQTTSEGAVAGDVVTVNYTGALADGTVFDSNVDPKFQHVQPFTFTLGVGQVIPGWDQGVMGMKVGEKKHLSIPPELGYGAQGAGSAIPPNATLEFDVEVTAISHK